jgi:hypothetical protein
MSEIEGPLKRGRPDLGLTVVKVGLDDEALRFVDEHRGDEGRATFVRELVRDRMNEWENLRDDKPWPANITDQIEAARPFMGPAVSEAAVPAKPALELVGDERKVVAEIRATGPMTVRDMVQRWKWSEGVAKRVTDRMAKKGLIHYPRGGGLIFLTEAV